jgi:hypothetical protein
MRREIDHEHGSVRFDRASNQITVTFRRPQSIGSPAWLGRSPGAAWGSPGRAAHGPFGQTHPDVHAVREPTSGRSCFSFFRSESRPERDLPHKDILGKVLGQYIQGLEMLPPPVLVLIGELLAARLMLPAG